MSELLLISGLVLLDLLGPIAVFVASWVAVLVAALGVALAVNVATHALEA